MASGSPHFEVPMMSPATLALMSLASLGDAPLLARELSPAERFALAAEHATMARTRRNGPSPKSARRRAKLAANVQKAGSDVR